jgi:hypothetical protein
MQGVVFEWFCFLEGAVFDAVLTKGLTETSINHDEFEINKRVWMKLMMMQSRFLVQSILNIAQGAITNSALHLGDYWPQRVFLCADSLPLYTFHLNNLIRLRAFFIAAKGTFVTAFEDEIPVK